MKDGYDVRGFMYWTLIDNFEYALSHSFVALLDNPPEKRKRNTKEMKNRKKTRKNEENFYRHLAGSRLRPGRAWERRSVSA